MMLARAFGRADQLDDRRLAARFFAGHGDGLEDVYRAYGSVLYAVAKAILLVEEDAEDCVHDTLLRVWRSETYRPERGTLRTYLAACVRNDAITRKRTETRHQRIERRAVASEQTACELDAGDPLERGRLRAAITALPADQRAALSLAYAQHLTHREIADRLGVPIGTVKGRLRLALRKLQFALTHDADVSRTD